MTTIREDIVNQGHGYLSPVYFAVHSTANPGATARNHRDLWSRNYDYAVHLVSDWTDAYHCVPYNRLCWQVGNGNATCEGLEICEATNAADFAKGIQIAAEVVAQRLKAHGWSVDRMHPHQWFSRTYGGSDHTDPMPYFTRYGYSWDKFVNLVKQKLNGDDMAISKDDLYNIAMSVWTFAPKGSSNKQPYGNPYETLKRVTRGGGHAYATKNSKTGKTGGIWWLTPTLERHGFGTWAEWEAFCKANDMATSNYTILTETESNNLVQFLSRAAKE
ncbi:N-acetylmuramoyl-L-alanine amidase [Bifidobacterium amazonense]|uniref:N-acetylmuramoyl-L-alanine amidase n=1 Tax=Bifidobacterium amazonense TaxID=2809027 RepID=A0ABS9VSG7_9BIFI|nr:N-acetylmuramoyl-L-alanine amidase [Bifidobacterium amazonense]MCH9275017.1 N-acetylmuramoyl-L-alanine amidase [Bifidobacterium amazonense]